MRSIIKQAINWRKVNPDNWPTDRALRVREGKAGVAEWGYFSDRNQWWVLVRLRFVDDGVTILRDQRMNLDRMPPGVPPKGLV